MKNKLSYKIYMFFDFLHPENIKKRAKNRTQRHIKEIRTSYYEDFLKGGL